MNNRKMQIAIIILLLAIGITNLILYIRLNRDEPVEEIESSNTYISKMVEDECTDEYIEQQNATVVVSTEEKVSASAVLILKKYYMKCEHTINEYVELPPEIVNMTEEQVQNQYPDWEVIGFEADKVTLYKEFDDECGEHFKLKIDDGKIVVFLINKDATETLYKTTNISSEYLTETDLINMQDGLEIYGIEELNKIIEDFE